ncbi:MAG: extracellular solute-binding protein [Rhodovibrionaceae bacterium]|nr:extracellular solute-binding protein [Rhodovibrionaceae bacterium]
MRHAFLLIAIPLLWIVSAALAQEGGQTVHKSHAIAMHGEPKYPADFRHFDYLNPDAPKAGEMVLGDNGNWDTFNTFIIKGAGAPGMNYLYDRLMVSSADEPFTMYGLIAETVEWPEDRSWVIFNINPDARWHDGQPITAEDVVWTFETLKEKGTPNFRFYYASVDKAEALGRLRVKFSFTAGDNRELPLIVGQMQILPKHYWEEREFDKTTLEPPLGSGPYRIGDFEPNRFIEWRRVPDYWAKDHPVHAGQYNLDVIRYESFFDQNVIREAIKGGILDFREENQAKAWALDYETQAVKDGWLVKEKVEHNRPAGMQAFIMNTRRPLFADPRVRRAMAYAFDFEWTNRNLFFGQYTRTESYFANSELASDGLPTGREEEILREFEDRLPARLFAEPYFAPSTNGTGWSRENLLKALDLLRQAGWVVRDMQLVNAQTGAPFEFEFMLAQQAFERIILPYVRNLKRLGIEVRVRLVDTSQYINRVRSQDFDMIVAGWGQSESPGNEQRAYWHSESADQPGTRNYAGISDPVIDKLVEMVIAAPTREELVHRTRALDRVLLWGHYVVPNWHLNADRLLYWDKFDRPDTTPDNGTSIDYWWWDADKALAVERRQRGQQSAERNE